MSIYINEPVTMGTSFLVRTGVRSGWNGSMQFFGSQLEAKQDKECAVDGTESA